MSGDMKVQAEGGHHGGLGGSGWIEGNNPSAAPPGFMSGHSRGFGDGRAQSMGAPSAPPPPGFNDGKPRVPNTADQLWSNERANAPRDDKGRTASFKSLEAVLGSGLAESMEDATRGEPKGGFITDNFLFSTENDLSYKRHSRHTSRRAPKEGSEPSHKGTEAGPLFASNASHPLFGEYPKDSSKQDQDRNTAPGFPTTFLGDATDRMGGFRSSYDAPKSSASSYDGNGNGLNSRLPTTKDLGLTVMEPSDFGGLGLSDKDTSRRNNDGAYEIQRDMEKLWSNKEKGVNQRTDYTPKHSDSVGGSSAGDVGHDAKMEAEEDLRPFTWDVRHHEASRTLAISRASSTSSNELRSLCSRFGDVDNFRSDFSNRGVYFVTYYDMRTAQYAAMELQKRLQRSETGDIRPLVQFCVPLNSSSQNDDSLVVLNDVPMNMQGEKLTSMLSSYGAVRSLKNLGGSYGGSSFLVEYHDLQDAKQAVLELESTQPWGPDVSIETGARNPSDRKRGRELLALLGRWRHGEKGGAPNRSQGTDHRMYGGSPGQSPREMYKPPSPETPPASYVPGGRHDTRYDPGPDGRYSYMVVHHPGYPPQGGMPPHYTDRMMHPGHGSYVTHVHPPPSHQMNYQNWPTQTHHFSSAGSVVSASSYGDRSHHSGLDRSHHSGPYSSGSRSTSYYTDASSAGSHSRMTQQSTASAAGEEKDNRHLMLDLDAVENGHDNRTSLMVRNIPNKYTQQMLLSEFTEHGHGPGSIDFFYLPIDFKNRCNRGYAFINFVDYRDILTFHRRYYGKHWRTFNSDKICDITYARIQGKSAMLKRFENSALMEKDDEYKPLVFVSHGADKGTRLPFPDPSTKG